MSETQSLSAAPVFMQFVEPVLYDEFNLPSKMQLLDQLPIKRHPQGF
jgi:hypothetical protein